MYLCILIFQNGKNLNLKSEIYLKKYPRGSRGVKEVGLTKVLRNIIMLQSIFDGFILINYFKKY